MQTALLILFSLLQFQSTSGDSYGEFPPAAAVQLTHPEILVLVELVNQRRSAVGCEQLTWHAGIAGVAEAHSLDMQRRDFYDHVDPDGGTLLHRLTRAGIAFNGVAGENLVVGTVDGTIAYALWIDSDEHRANIENCDYTHHGVGLADGRWTHVFVQRPLS